MTETHSHTNRLIHATSPYLLQHAHNPVDWYEWGPEAFEKARAEDKPVFLSIGYSACHWCHVMERESFENEDVAAIMNAHFVCIKVDREERPDLDDIYMTATQAMTGSGGWPMSVWLTPDQRPFYAGTYFPPDDHFGRPGFKRVLTFLADTWERNRDKVTQQAEQLTAAIQSHLSGERGDEIVPPSVVIESAQKIAGAFDHQRGGISGGGTNKFPPSMAMDVMLRAYHASRARGGSGPGEPSGPDAELLELVELTLDRMAQGGIYDQLGGGIARYSTDVDWLVPHFEKMLYDQALVSGIYLDAYRLTGKALYRRVAAEILDYVIDDLQSPEGGYYCTRDADSEGEEGRFYVWSKAEVEAALGEDAVVFCDYYDVTEDGNWEGHNILHVQRPAETVAKLHGFSVEALESHLKRGRETLLALREKRVKPHLDDKVIASWNGLMIASMARGYRILGDERYRESAVRAADFVLKEMSVNGQLNRTYRKGKTHTAGFLEDYAFMIEGLLNLYETTFELRWLDRAAALNQALIQHFRDDAAGGFFFTDDRAEKVLARAKDAGDSAIPSGNSVQLMNLLRLSILLDRKDLGTEAERVLRAFGKGLRENPFRSERMLAAVDFHHRRPREIALVTHGMNDSRFRALLDAVWGTYVPNQVIAGVDEGSDEAGVVRTRVPLLDGKTLLGGSPAAYVCRDFACKAPTADPVALRQQIEN